MGGSLMMAGICTTSVGGDGIIVLGDRSCDFAAYVRSLFFPVGLPPCLPIRGDLDSGLKESAGPIAVSLCMPVSFLLGAG